MTVGANVNSDVFHIENGVKFGNARQYTFDNIVELNDWWSKNPTAYWQYPNHNGENYTIEEHNAWNHNLKFPLKVTFMFPV